MTINKTHCSADFSLVEKILDQKNDTEVSIIRAFCEKVKNPLITGFFCHLVVSDNQVIDGFIQVPILSWSAGIPLTNSVVSPFLASRVNTTTLCED